MTDDNEFEEITDPLKPPGIFGALGGEMYDLQVESARQGLEMSRGTHLVEWFLRSAMAAFVIVAALALFAWTVIGVAWVWSQLP